MDGPSIGSESHRIPKVRGSTPRSFCHKNSVVVNYGGSINKVKVLIAAGGRGKRLCPITYEKIGSVEYKRYPKGTLPLAGFPVIYYQLTILEEVLHSLGIQSTKYTFHTTHGNVERIKETLKRFTPNILEKIDFIIGPYKCAYERFREGLDSRHPTINLHDDTIFSRNMMTRLIVAFRERRLPTLTFSNTSTNMGRDVTITTLKRIRIPQDALITPKIHYTSIRIYDPNVKELAYTNKEIRQTIEKDNFRESDIDLILIKRGLAQAVVSDEIVNINTAEDLLRANSFALRIRGIRRYIAPIAKVNDSAKVINSSIYDNCNIGNSIVTNSIILTGTTVRDNSKIKNAVIGSDSTIRGVVRGSANHVFVIGNRKIVETD